MGKAEILKPELLKNKIISVARLMIATYEDEVLK